MGGSRKTRRGGSLEKTRMGGSLEKTWMGGSLEILRLFLDFFHRFEHPGEKYDRTTSINLIQSL